MYNVHLPIMLESENQAVYRERERKSSPNVVKVIFHTIRNCWEKFVPLIEVLISKRCKVVVDSNLQVRVVFSKSL